MTSSDGKTAKPRSSSASASIRPPRLRPLQDLQRLSSVRSTSPSKAKKERRLSDGRRRLISSLQQVLNTSHSPCSVVLQLLLCDFTPKEREGLLSLSFQTERPLEKLRRLKRRLQSGGNIKD